MRTRSKHIANDAPGNQYENYARTFAADYCRKERQAVSRIASTGTVYQSKASSPVVDSI